MWNNWRKYGIDVPANRTEGNYKTFCPNCHDERHNKSDKSLSCNLATGEYLCHYCGWKGCAAEKEQWEIDAERAAWFNQHPVSRQRKEYRRPKPRPAAPMSEKALAWFKGRGISAATLTSMKVTEGLEFMPQDGRERNTVQFNYYLEGELINTKFRTGDKHFKFVQGAELLPYNIDGIRGESSCIITEGEMDALSFMEVGYRNTVSVPAGANTNLEWLDGYFEGWFDDKQTIYIASDTDTKGVVLRDELLRRFGVERCKVVEYGEGCKDANEHLMKYGADSLRQCVTEARDVPVSGIFTVSDFEQSLDEVYQSGWRRGVTIGHPDFDRICSFETKRLCVITGIPGSGKSEWIDEMAERLNIRYNWRFAYFSPENAPLAYHGAKLVEKFTGKRFGSKTMPLDEYTEAKERLERDFSFIAPTDNFRLDNILDKARVLVRRRGIRCLVIDPYNRIESEMGNRSETLYISQMLDKLTNFAQLNDVLVVLMAHPTKLQRDKQTGQVQRPTLYDISGSANFYNKCDFGIVVHRDRTENTTTVSVQKVKFRHLGEPGDALFRYNLRNGRYTPYKVGDTQTAWDDTNHLREGIAEVPDYETALGDGNHRYRGGEDEEQTAAPVQQAAQPLLQWGNGDDEDDCPFGEMPF